ncbi:unnamed protein product [Clonostachys byssicola]|uniref:TAFII55 protein conserved region domain-containing protein n=1 Tax=Clonostachys byssicola TaxID=160290 RepID=A0A9N9XVI9_9HYPO|nr:unnamed protein product [Clonostachys byssicola]
MPGPDGAPAPPRPRLKLNPSRSSSFAVDSNATSLPSAGGGGAAAAAASPTVATPRTESQRKVTLKIHSSAPPTPLEPPQPTKTKAGRQPKPSQKVVENKKRPLEDDEDAPLAASAHRQHHQPPKKKLSVVRPVIKTGGLGGGVGGAKQLLIKQKGRPPVHPPGDGYDSEASDRERDPHIEEQLVLRMMPGEHADYVRWCIENGKIGVSKAQGGADLQIKFFEEDGRRAVVAVKGQPYAAVMVDLPTITEAMKTWDRKSFMKSADICQMLLVFQKVKSEDEAKKVPLPKVLEGNSHFKWPHGLTPPMHDAVNRRFAKTISRKEIEDKEAEVERLLADDAKAASTKWEWVDDRQNEGEEEEEEEEEDAEGEVDESGFFGTDAGDDIADVDLEADLEAAFADEFMAETPIASGITAETPMTSTQVGTPDVVKDSVESEEDEEEEEDDDDDDDDDDEDLDDDERAQRDEEQGIKDIISDMQKQLAQRRADWERTNNQILRSRIEAQIKQLKSEIELKMSSIGMEMDD